ITVTVATVMQMAAGWMVFGNLPGERREAKSPVERIQLGVRIEKRMAKVLKATAEYTDQSLGELLETIVLHAFAGSCPFSEEALRAIAGLKQVYRMEYDLGALPPAAEKGGA